MMNRKISTYHDAIMFQKCLGVMMIILGVLLVLLAGIFEGLWFAVVGIYMIVTKEIAVTLPMEEGEEE